MLVLLSLVLFCKERPDCVVYEVGMGGRFDPTNVLPGPTVCGVTKLDLDHTRVLGDTLELIAAEKSGIFKPGAGRAFTVQQPDGPMSVLAEAAEAVGLELVTVQPLPPDTKLALAGAHQLENAALAVALCSRIAAHCPAVMEALSAVRWKGRCQQLEHQGLSVLADGAHTADSMSCFALWARAQCPNLGRPALMFYCGAPAFRPRLSRLRPRARPGRAVRASPAGAAGGRAARNPWQAEFSRVFICEPQCTRPSALKPRAFDPTSGQLVLAADPPPWDGASPPRASCVRGGAETLVALCKSMAPQVEVRRCRVGAALEESVREALGVVWCTGSLYLVRGEICTD